MTLTFEVPADIEAELIAQAEAQGLDLPKYVEHVLREQIRPRETSPLSPAERAKLWRESARRLPLTPPLSDDAISRDSIYECAADSEPPDRTAKIEQDRAIRQDTIRSLAGSLSEQEADELRQAVRKIRNSWR